MKQELRTIHMPTVFIALDKITETISYAGSEEFKKTSSSERYMSKIGNNPKSILNCVKGLCR